MRNAIKAANARSDKAISDRYENRRRASYFRRLDISNMAGINIKKDISSVARSRIISLLIVKTRDASLQIKKGAQPIRHAP